MFVFIKCIRLMAIEPPYIIGGCAHLAGYMKELLGRESIELPVEVKDNVRKEHLGRIWNFNSIEF